MTIQRSPLIFALKHLHVQWEDGDLAAPSRFRQSASLMQEVREIPPAAEAKIDTLVREECTGALPQGAELELLEMALPGWPQDVALAFHGISTFGAGGIESARTCAQHVLKAHRDCTLARQLVSLLTAKSDVRCSFGTDAKDAPDVPSIVATEKEKGDTVKSESTEKIRFKCPQCAAQINAPLHAAGRRAKCPACGTAICVPAAPTKTATEPESSSGHSAHKSNRKPPSPQADKAVTVHFKTDHWRA